MAKALDGIAWGCFIVLIGAGWIAGEHYQMDTGPYVALGVGVILIGLNVARAGMNVKISKFSLFIGAIAVGIGGAGILGYSLPLIPTVVLLIGLFIVAETIQKLVK